MRFSSPGVLPGSRASGSIKVADAPVLHAEIVVLLAKDAIEPVPPADMRSGFVSPYFIVPKKSSGLRPILDLGVLIRALHKLPFKDVEAETHFRVRPSPRSVCSDRSEGCAHSCLNLPTAGHSCNSHSRVGYVSTSSCLSGTSASWVFGSIGERANSCQCR